MKTFIHRNKSYVYFTLVFACLILSITARTVAQGVSNKQELVIGIDSYKFMQSYLPDFNIETNYASSQGKYFKVYFDSMSCKISTMVYANDSIAHRAYRVNSMIPSKGGMAIKGYQVGDSYIIWDRGSVYRAGIQIGLGDAQG